MDQNSRQMPATIDHALDSHGTTDNPEEDDIAADGRDACALPALCRAAADGVASYSVSHETWRESPECRLQRAARVVLCNIAGDVVQIALDEAGEFQLYYFAMPPAPAIA
jgi:hypothetical protein